MKILIIALFSIALLPLAHAQKAPDDCSWESTSKSRRELKLRDPKHVSGYVDFNSGKAITLDQWFELTCQLDSLVPEKLSDAPVAGAENMRVTLRGYLLAAKFARDEDHDITVEIGATPEWRSDHVVLEMSAGAAYCEARKKLWDLLKRDGCKADQCFMRKPVEIEATGFVLMGNPPKDGPREFCQARLGRGLKRDNEAGQVRGLWRLQPVFKIVEVRNSHRS